MHFVKKNISAVGIYYRGAEIGRRGGARIHTRGCSSAGSELGKCAAGLVRCQRRGGSGALRGNRGLLLRSGGGASGRMFASGGRP